MQSNRKTLSLRVGRDADRAVAGPVDILSLAIARKFCVSIVYNKQTMILAPHIVYTRHDEPYVDGVVLEREGKPPRELKLGTFKLAGLGQLALTGQGFTVQPFYDPADPRYEGVTLSAISA